MQQAIEARARALHAQARVQLNRSTDRMFALLMLSQWAFAIVIALLWSPYGWAGKSSAVHLHLQAAVLLGGLLSGFPLVVIALRSGRPEVPYVVASAQMLWSALLIHLTGGRIETHFHVFGSLAFVAFYRDWKVLVPATALVVADHFLRGVYWPESVYGIANPEWWRFLEHAGWVVFEDVVLVAACVRASDEMWESSLRQAKVEELSAAELQDSRDAVVRSEKLAAVGQLAASVSHDLRSPLQAIRNAAVVLGKNADARGTQMVGIIDREVQVCVRIIENLLDTARERPLQVATVDLRVLVDEVFSVIRLAPDQKVELVNDASVRVNADGHLLRQALVNLVQNAVEAAPRRVRVAAISRTGGWRITVEDDGAGIPADAVERVFQPLFTTKAKGTGLGLAIVSSAAQRHGGAVNVHSEPGQGTTFTIDLPTAIPKAAAG